MKELRETTYDQYAGDNVGTFFSSESKMINRIHKLKKKFPDEVDIECVNDDGSILSHVPSNWFNITPKHKHKMTDKQRAEAEIRAEQMREIKRLKKSNNK